MRYVILFAIALLFGVEQRADARIVPRRNNVQVNVANGAAAQVNVNRGGFFHRNNVQVNVAGGVNRFNNGFYNRGFFNGYGNRQFFYGGYNTFGYGAAFL